MLAARLVRPAASGQAELARAAQLLCRRPAASGATPEPRNEQSDRPRASSVASEAPPPPPPAPPLGPPPPVMPASQQPPLHWLDSFGGVRLWLEEKNRQWWLKGLLERCKLHHQLSGREAELRAAAEREYAAAHARHAARAVDSRAETHLQVAALVLASHKVLLPFLRDEQEVLQAISEHVGGGKGRSVLRFLLKATKWLHRDGYAALAARLRGLQLDMGRGFATQLAQGAEESSLTISRCLYVEVFTEEGAPQLASACCCSQDRVWLEAVRYRGVQAGRTAAISAGDPHCCYVVRRQPRAGAAAAH